MVDMVEDRDRRRGSGQDLRRVLRAPKWVLIGEQLTIQRGRVTCGECGRELGLKRALLTILDVAGVLSDDAPR